jgi:hypothetical protein
MENFLATARSSGPFVASESHDLSIEFRYQLTGAGWSECTLIVDDGHVTVTASYLSDALRSLISAVCRVLEGTDEATAAFDEEPGEFRWRLYRIDDELVRVMILEFDDLWSDKPDSDGKPIFDVRCRLRTFAGAVYDGCKQLLAEHGHAGYKEQWHEHDYPDSEFEELKRLLDAKQTRRTKS